MRKLTKKIAVGLLTLISSASLTAGLAACGAKSEAKEAPTNVDITKLAAPTDGSLPTAHTGVENIAYIAGVLEAQTQYHCYTDTVTTASIATQVTKSYKDYKDGVLISSDITYSSMVKSGSQACFLEQDGEKVAYMRFSDAPTSTTTNLTAAWDDGSPTFYTERAYLYTYGLFQTELTNYIINENTILDYGEVQVNGNGTYSQSFTLDPVASTYYYQYGMKTRGGLGGYPEFEEITLNLTFDSSWRICSYTFHEVSKVNKGVTVTSISDSTSTYSYDAADFDNAHFAYYDSYFKNYIGSDDVIIGGDVEDELDMSLTGVLSNGFSKIMDGGQQFEVTADVGDKTLKGYVFLSLDLADPLNTLELRLSLGKTLQDQGLYVEYADGSASAYYSDDFAVDVNIAAVKLIVEQFSEWADGINSAFANANNTAMSTQADEESDVLSTLLGEMDLKVSDKQALLTLSSDDLLGYGIGINARFIFGVSDNTIVFRGATIKGLSFGGEGLDLSLTLTPTTAEIINRQNTGTNADLSKYIADVYSLLSSDLIKVNFVLDGNDDKVKVSSLKGLSVGAVAYVDIDGVTVGGDFDVSYKYNGKTLSAKLNAYYNYDTKSSGYGNVILTLTNINGTDTNLQVGCDVAELAEGIKSILSLAQIQTSAFSADQKLSLNVASIINNVLSSDIKDLVSNLTADNAKIGVSVDVDNLLDVFGIDVGVAFGSCRLEYSLGQNGKIGVLSAQLPAIGFSLSVTGASGSVTAPDTTNCLDLCDAIDTVKVAYAQITDVIKNQTLYFTLPENGTEITYAGVTAGIEGEGQIVWANNSQKVALDLNVYALTDGDSDKTNVKFIYDKNAGNDKPVVRLAINGVGADIYSSDIDDFTSQLNSILSSLNIALDNDNNNNKKSSLTSVDLTNLDKAQIFELVFGLLANDDLLDILSNITLSSSNSSVVLNYISDNVTSVSVTADEGLALAISSANGNNFAAKANIIVSNTQDDLYTQLNQAFDGDGYQMATTKEGKTFIRLVYDYLFDVIDTVSFDNLLGDSTYNVAFKIDGASSDIAALKGVTVDAELYYTGKTNNSKLTEMDVNVDVDGTAVVINVVVENVNGQRYYYLNPAQVADIKLPDLKVVATKDDLDNTVDELIKIITQTNVLKTALSLTGVDMSASLPDFSGSVISDSAIDTIKNVVCTLLTADFSDIFVQTTSGDKVTTYLDIDKLIGVFGVKLNYTIGTVEAVVDSRTHTVETSVTNTVESDGKVTTTKWITLKSEIVAKKSYAAFDKTEYLNISFLPTIISDFVNFATNNDGDMYTTYTFSGDVTAKIAVTGLSLTVNIDICNLTVNLDKDNFYFSVVAHTSKATALLMTAVKEDTIGITYSNGYLTLARGLTSTPEYRIMTLEYFIDNLFAESDTSPLQWLLGTNSTVWNMAASPLKDSVGLDSGLSNAQDLYLYSKTESVANRRISLYNYISSLSVVLGGEEQEIGNSFSDFSTAKSNLKIAKGQDYYGFDLNASYITNGTLTALSAALLRDADNGITGLAAYGNVSGMVSFNVNLNYNEGASDVYEVGTPLTSGMVAPNFYANIEGTAKSTLDYTQATFAEYVAAYNADKASSNVIFGEYVLGDEAVKTSGISSKVTLTVKNFSDVDNVQAEAVDTYSVSIGADESGANIYLYSNDYPQYSDDTKTQRVVYVNSNGTLLGNSIKIKQDTTIYLDYRQAVVINIYDTASGENKYVKSINTFVGENMITSVDGYSFLDDKGLTYANGDSVGSGAIATDGGSGVITINVYGNLIVKEVTSDGVVYAFDEANYSSTKQITYYVSKLAGDENTYKYYEEKQTLVLKDNINGYPVTAIAAKALKNTNGAEETSLKHIVVPASITKVGENAFSDNYGILSVVFLADNVTFDGKDGDSKTMPFYGCSTTSSDKNKANEKTSLVVYYNTITASGGKWTHFRYIYNGWWYNFYIGEDGGETHGAGTWAYVDLEYSNSTDLTGLDAQLANITTGLTTNIPNAAAIQTQLTDWANNITATSNDKCIDKYVITVTSEKDAQGYTIVTVNVEYGTPKYLVTIDKGDYAEDVDVSGDCKVFNGNVYANGQIEVTAVNITTKYVLSNWSDGTNQITTNPATFEINGVTNLIASYNYSVINITLDSAVDFTYASQTYEAGTFVIELSSVNGQGVLFTPVAVETGYVFLGWANSDGEFVQLADNNVTYKAIWGKSAVNSPFTAEVNTSGSTISAPVGNGVTLDGNWYSDSTFATEIKNIADDTDGVLYTRTQYTLKYTISGSGTRYNDTYANVNNGYELNKSTSFTIYEGQKIEVERSTDKHSVTITVDGTEKTTITLNSFKVGFISCYYTFKDEETLSGGTGSWSNDSVNQDLTLTFKYGS